MIQDPSSLSSLFHVALPLGLLLCTPHTAAEDVQMPCALYPSEHLHVPSILPRALTLPPLSRLMPIYPIDFYSGLPSSRMSSSLPKAIGRPPTASHSILLHPTGRFTVLLTSQPSYSPVSISESSTGVAAPGRQGLRFCPAHY